MFLGIKLMQGLLLSLNQLINIFHTRGSNLTRGRHHDPVKEFNVRLQFVAVGITFPVKINFDSDLRHPRDEIFMFLDESGQKIVLFLSLRLGSLSHQNLTHLGQPLLNLNLLQIFAQSLRVDKGLYLYLFYYCKQFVALSVIHV